MGRGEMVGREEKMGREESRQENSNNLTGIGIRQVRMASSTAQKFSGNDRPTQHRLTYMFYYNLEHTLPPRTQRQ